jgi:hypothetical protein
MTDISIYSEAFHNLRNDFDKMMIETIQKMQQKCSSDASITIKLDIELEKTFDPVDLKDGTRTTRDVYIPHFSHKVTSAIQIKSQLAGRYDEECELVWNPIEEKYLLCPIGMEQMTLDTEYNREDDEEC